MMKIAKALNDDAQILANLSRETYLFHFAEIWHKEDSDNYLNYHYEVNTIKKPITSSFTEYYFILESEKAVGFCKINYNKPLPFGDRVIEIEIEKIYLLPQSVGKGYGSALIIYLSQTSLQKQIPFLWLAYSSQIQEE